MSFNKVYAILLRCFVCLPSAFLFLCKNSLQDLPVLTLGIFPCLGSTRNILGLLYSNLIIIFLLNREILEITEEINTEIFKIQNYFHQQMHTLLIHKMLKLTIKISLYSLLHVSVLPDHPQGAYAEPC
jgi:hypothetical protein